MQRGFCWTRYGATLLVGFCLPAAAWAQGWWLEGGPVFRGGMNVKVSGSTYGQQMGVHDPLAKGPLAPPGEVGPVDSYADRTYDNGYVKKDPGTGNPDAVGGPNTTWNWGYNSAGQYNGAANTLSFQKTGEPGFTTLLDRPTHGSDDAWGPGFQLTAGLPLANSEKLFVDLCLGFEAIWGQESKFHATNYREAVRQITVTDTYDTSGIAPADFPGAGFRGTFLGPFDSPPVIPSPIIPNLPANRAQATSEALSTSADSVSLGVEQSLYQFSVGPQLGWAASERVRLHVRPTISLNIVDVDAERGEVFVQQPVGGAGVVVERWSNHQSEQEVLFGLGVTAGVDVDLGRGFYAGGFGGYEWVADTVEVKVGPNKVSFDGSGYVFGLVLGKRF